MPLQHTIFLAINIFPGHPGLFDFDLQRYFMKQAKLMKKFQINDTPRLNIKDHGMTKFQKMVLYPCSYCSEFMQHYRNCYIDNNHLRSKNNYTE